MPISAGELDRVITIQKQAEPLGQDAIGGVVESWVDVFRNLPAGKRAATGREVFTANQNARQIDTVFVVRWKDGITTAMRLLHDGLVYDIQSVNREIGRGEGLLIEAKVRL